MLVIKKDVLERMINHAKRDLPLEACGYVASKNGVSNQHFEMRNADQSPEHYSLDPEEQFKVLKEIRNIEMDISAVYHSHPETPARPSKEDIRLAYDPSISYIIISLAGGEESVKSFKIAQGEVTNEEIQIVD